MKKLLSIILSVSLLLALLVIAGCKSETQETQETPTDTVSPAQTEDVGTTDTQDVQIVEIGDLARIEVKTSADGTAVYNGHPYEELIDSKPNEYIAEKIAAGIEVLVGASYNQMKEEVVVLTANGVVSEMEALGVKVIVSDAQDDIPTQLQQIENLLTMRAAYINVVMTTIDSFADIAAQALAQGSYFSVVGQVPQYLVSGYINLDHVLSGTECGKMAIAWLDKQYPNAAPGSVATAVIGHTKVPPVAARTKAIEETIKADSRVNYVFYKDDCNSIDMAYTATEEALTVNPDIKLICCFSTAQAVGSNNYLLTIPNINTEEYGVFCTGVDESSFALIDEAGKGGESVLRGSIGQGSVNPYDSTVNLMKILLFQNPEEMPYVYLDPLWAYNSVGYEFDTR